MSHDDTLRELAEAYEGIDDLDAFADAAALERYRASLLERTEPQADFIAARLPQAACVVEVACGNGRLLVALAGRGALARGHGVDIARSRIAFAQRWVADLRHEQLAFDAGDLLDAELAPGTHDAAICITGALGYFEPASPGLASTALKRLRAALRAGGLLVLELYPHPRERALLEAAGGEARLWHELANDERWRFYLSHLELDAGTSFLTHAKTFIHRTSGEVDSGRRERILLYTPQSITALLQETGFGDIALHEGWTEAPYEGGDVMVVTATPSRG